MVRFGKRGRERGGVSVSFRVVEKNVGNWAVDATTVQLFTLQRLRIVQINARMEGAATT